MGFLIFSCARTIFLSGLYALAHCRRVKNLMSTMHTVRRAESSLEAKHLALCFSAAKQRALPRPDPPSLD